MVLSVWRLKLVLVVVLRLRFPLLEEEGRRCLAAPEHTICIDISTLGRRLQASVASLERELSFERRGTAFGGVND